MKFWNSLDDATKELEGTHYEEDYLKCGRGATGGQLRWPTILKIATIFGTPYGCIEMKRVDCYGWRICNSSLDMIGDIERYGK